MTKEEKQILLIDLCGRFPYGVKANGYPWITSEYVYGINKDAVNLQGSWVKIENVKPYLRPMSSMSEEEKKELRQEHVKDEKLYAECLTNTANGDDSMRGKVIPHFASDWCNKNHFDYRGLIPMGLALEAKEGMYKDN